jgi:hypothetical protein
MGMASYCGAGYYFVDLGGLYLVYAFFPFPVIMAQIIGDFWRIGEAVRAT